MTCRATMMPKKYSVQNVYRLINRLLMRKHILYALMMLKNAASIHDTINYRETDNDASLFKAQ